MKFLDSLKKNYRNLTLTAYLLPILISVGVSLVHVTAFWEITNPLSWAIFLSIAIEIGVLSSIAASRFSKWAWLPFTLVTFVQVIGNIFYSYLHVDVAGLLFKNWVELVDPFFNFIGFGTDGDIVVHKRIVAVLSGTFIPLLSIIFFRFFINASQAPVPVEPVVEVPVTPPITPPKIEIQDHIPTPATPIAHIIPEEVMYPPQQAPPDWFKNNEAKPLSQEEMKEIIAEVEAPSEARDIIQNMHNISPELMHTSFGTTMKDINHIAEVYPAIETFDAPNIEVQAFPDPEPVQMEEMPEIVTDYPAEVEVIPDIVAEPEHKRSIVDAIVEQHNRTSQLTNEAYRAVTPEPVPAPEVIEEVVPEMLPVSHTSIKDRVLSRIKSFGKNGN